MKIKVYAPGFLDFNYIDENGYMELEDGSTINEVFKKLKVPFYMKKFLIFSVNYEKASLKTRLKEGDTVSFLTPLSGG
jgi:molybdopterin converting factor small subunit